MRKYAFTSPQPIMASQSLDLELLTPFQLTEVCSTENADEICTSEYIYSSDKKGYQQYFDRLRADGKILVTYIPAKNIMVDPLDVITHRLLTKC